MDSNEKISRANAAVDRCRKRMRGYSPEKRAALLDHALEIINQSRKQPRKR